MAKKKSWLSTPVIWSAAMDRLFREQVVQPVTAHPETDFSENVLLGYDFQVIRNDVIKQGLADFTQGHGNLTDDEVALLYCFINMKGHFFSSYANFRLNKVHLQKLFDQTRTTVMFDLGCGPGTSALALSELLPKRKLLYYGIDVAPAMRKKAKQMWNAGVAHGLISPKSVLGRNRSWTTIDVSRIEEPCSVLVNFAYFFASHSLNNKDIASLAQFVHNLAARPNVKMLTISYTNSPEDVANKKYLAFKGWLGSPIASTVPVETMVQFYKNRGGNQTGSQRFKREFIKIKP